MKFCHKNNICILFIKKLKKKIFDLKIDFFFFNFSFSNGQLLKYSQNHKIMLKKIKIFYFCLKKAQKIIY